MESITEVGESSTATGIGNPVRSRILGDSKQQFLIGGLMNVPDHLRKVDEQAFTPLLISIGPIHHSNVKLQNMKKCKAQFSKCFIQRANTTSELLEGIIRVKEEEIRSYYAETIVSSISSNDFVTMIVEDGMFILEYFLRQSNPHLEENDANAMIAQWMRPILKFDLVLLENQLPFFVLETLFKQANFPAELGLKPLSLRELAFKFFECYNFQMMDLEEFNADIEHFTDLVRLFYLKASERLPDRKVGGVKLSYSATQLHEAGVKLKGVKFIETIGYFADSRFGRDGRNVRHVGLRRWFLDLRFLPRGVVYWLRRDVMRKIRPPRCFLEIRFNNGVLEIPCITLNDERIRLIRNIIALEQSLYAGHAYVTDFFVILDFLIDNSKDVDLLCDKGILVNYLGDSNAMALAINSLNTKILWDFMNPKYSEICEGLNAFYKKHWHRWRATLWRQYFSTPWRAASTSAAIILLVLTAIQTICALKSTNW
ncbi:UPF0481 protein At3g47200-like [Quercus lobata]|uniref:UPF0481 protein At3g47200-like n=1 Tax=Quercus lobata TaxID=97700 RepID=UPI001245EA2C|nr:UPF0481 protein At3g47200-like [Quercus lobata]